MQVQQKTYICTSDAVKHSLCSTAELGRFITSLPPGRPMNSTSIWTARVVLDNEPRQNTTKQPEDTSPGLWNNPQGNPVLPDTTDNNHTSLSRRTIERSVSIRQDDLHETIHYSSPLRYPVTKSGYYCAGRQNEPFVTAVSIWTQPSSPSPRSTLHIQMGILYSTRLSKVRYSFKMYFKAIYPQPTTQNSM
jgi:hypothetical protein